jgi:glutamate-5-semialdehyde dehydrogenase
MMASGSSSVEEIARRARAASLALQDVPTEKKDAALAAIKQLLAERRDEIIAANEKDMEV